MAKKTTDPDPATTGVVAGEDVAGAEVPAVITDAAHYHAMLLPLPDVAVSATDDPFADVPDAAGVSDEGEQPDVLRVPIVGIVHGKERFEMPDGELVTAFTGRIIDTHRCNAWWTRDRDREDGTNRMPDCASSDAVTPDQGEDRQAARCAECPLNAFGSGVTDTGEATRGKACKNMRRVHVLVPGHALPLRLTLTPTSMRAYDDYYPALADRGLKPWKVATTFRLNHMSEGQREWSVVVMEFTGVPAVSHDEAVGLVDYIIHTRPFLRRQAITRADFEPVAGDGGAGSSVPADHEPFVEQF